VIGSGGCGSRRVPMGSRANKYLIAITDGHPAMQDELSGTEKGTKRCFSSYHRGRRRLFSTPNAPARESFRSSGDAQVPLATTEPITARNYRNFPQRGIDGIHHRRELVRVSRACRKRSRTGGRQDPGTRLRWRELFLFWGRARALATWRRSHLFRDLLLTVA
jgi:hypothetical protein